MIYYVSTVNLDKVYAYDPTTNKWFFGNGDPTKPYGITYTPCSDMKLEPPGRWEWKAYMYKKYQSKISYLNREYNV